MKTKDDKVHGEGNYKAAREFDAAEAAFVKSGRVDQAARDAAPKSAAEEAELARAEQLDATAPAKRIRRCAAARRPKTGLKRRGKRHQAMADRRRSIGAS